MKRTFLAIGLAVLASMLFAPHHDHWSALDGVRWKSRHEAYYTTRRANVFDDIPPTITVAGHGLFDFPREMTPDQIRDVLRKKFPSGEEIVFIPPTPSPTFDPDEYLAHSKAPAGKTFNPTTARPGEPWLDWVTVYHPAEDFYYQPSWVDEWKWYPAFWPASSLLLTPFIAQTVFLSILVAVLANWQRRKRAGT
jgi:hypothetical protein